MFDMGCTLICLKKITKKKKKIITTPILSPGGKKEKVIKLSSKK